MENEKPYIKILMPKDVCKNCSYLKKIYGKFTHLDGTSEDLVECYLCSIMDLKVGDICPNCLMCKLIDD